MLGDKQMVPGRGLEPPRRKCQKTLSLQTLAVTTVMPNCNSFNKPLRNESQTRTNIGPLQHDAAAPPGTDDDQAFPL